MEAKENLWVKWDNEKEELEKDGAEAPKEFLESAPPEFTAEDKQEKEDLMKEGFSQWNKRDFYKFINMCEMYGRNSFELFTELHAVGKSTEEIE